MSEMKLILESWRSFLHEIDLAPCPQQPINVGDFKVALDLAASDPEVQKAKIEKLKKQREGSERLGKILGIVSLVAGVPTLGASAGLSFAAGLLGTIAFAYKAKQEKGEDQKVNQLMGLLCIDDDLLDVMDNRIEKEYWANSDLKQQIDAYVNSANPDEPMPNFTQHFLHWLNNESDYASDTASTPNTKVIEK
tara:strand:+ start:10574 stop:11152 length:579 start_codon:yes stop_codon:yes gene_type:complete